MPLTGDSLLVRDLARRDLAVDALDGASLLYATSEPAVTDGAGRPRRSVARARRRLAVRRRGAKQQDELDDRLERVHNPLLVADRDEFVRGLTEEIPPPPPNVERIVAINCSGSVDPPAVGELAPERMHELLQPNISVLDARSPEAYDERHPAGSVNLPRARHGNARRLVGDSRRGHHHRLGHC
jgi:hypothetical protein